MATYDPILMTYDPVFLTEIASIPPLRRRQRVDRRGADLAAAEASHHPARRVLLRPHTRSDSLGGSTDSAFFYVECVCNGWFTFELLIRLVVSPNKLAFQRVSKYVRK